MPEFPRFTGALRTFGTVSLPDDEGPSNDLALRKSLALQKQKERSPSWNTLVSFIKRNASVSHSETSAAVKQLLAIAKSIGEFLKVVLVKKDPCL